MHKENLYEIITPLQIRSIVDKAMKKLPSNFEILCHPLLSTKVKTTQDTVFVYVYLSMAERTEFSLLKATSVPLSISNNRYGRLR